MKWYWFVGVLVAGAVLPGCPSDSELDRLFAVTERYHALQVADEMQRDTYVVDSPEWTALDRKIELRQQTVDNAWAQVLRDGILVSLTDATLTAKWVADAEYRYQITYDLAVDQAVQALRTQVRDQNDQLTHAALEIQRLNSLVVEERRANASAASTHPRGRVKSEE